MDPGQELGDRFGNTVDLGVEVWLGTSRLRNPPVQPNRFEEFLEFLSALPALLSLASSFVESLARLDEQVRIFCTSWDNSDVLHRGLMLLTLFNSLAQNSLPGLVSQGWAYLMQGHLREVCRQIWSSSSLEAKFIFIMVLVWVSIFHVFLPTYQWLRQGG